MAEIKGIDVSRWNGKIDWKTVANYGMGFAILRITEKGNIIDSTFEPNYKGCIENKIPVGVYKYSYATTIAQIKNEANVVIKTLNKRKLDYPVFLDIEDKCQENLSDNLMMKMIEAFRAIIVKAGYKFGIYCGYSWYQNQLPEGAKKYDCWVARYPNNDTGELQERLRVPASTGVIGWQYSSKATIPGIPTKTDRSVFYKDYSKSSTTSTNSPKALEKKLSDMEQKIADFEQSQHNYHDQSVNIRDKLEDNQKVLQDGINELKTLLINKEIDDIRTTILDFSNAVMNGRDYNKEQYEHIIDLYDKYEKILEQNGMTNGRVTASMEFVLKNYQDLMDNGFKK